MMQLNEIDSSEKIDAIEKHLLTQINKMQIPCKTNEMLEQLKENQMLLLTSLIHEIRFTRNLVQQMGDALEVTEMSK